MRAQSGGAVVAADIGGTFTDLAWLDAEGRIHTAKVLSTPASFADAVLDGVGRLAETLGMPASAIGDVHHATTVATNAILEHKGARTALVTTRGFRDVLELRRIRVPRLYEPLYVKPRPLVPRALRLEVTERIDSRGQVVTPLDVADVDRVVERLRHIDVEAIAICFINAYADDRHERAVGERLRAEFPERFVCLSTEVLPEIREYERTSTTVVNGYVGPLVRRYLTRLEDALRARGVGGRLKVMHSGGHIADLHAAVQKPAHLVECGPAAGVIGAARIAKAAALPRIITLDMGGTTAKASIVEDGSYLLAEDYEVGGGISLSGPLVMGGGYALRLPVIDLAEVGAGGGSLAEVDHGGLLKVGPESAGADPGPACYGRGGTRPTVADADLVLGYLDSGSLAGGRIRLDRDAAARALEERIARPLGQSLVEAAWGVRRIVNATMSRAVKSVSTYRGRDPRDFALLAYGGSGPVHAAELARVLGIRTVVVPAAAGVFSALGLLLAEEAWSGSKGHLALVDDTSPEVVTRIFATLEQEAAAALGRNLAVLSLTRQAAMRFRGQAYELAVPVPEGPLDRERIDALTTAFRSLHEVTYGHGTKSDLPVQFVAFRLVAAVPGALDPRVVESARPAGHTATDRRHPSDRRVYFGPAHGRIETPVLGREDLDKGSTHGPLLIEGCDHAIVVPPGATARLGPLGQVIVTLGEG